MVVLKNIPIILFSIIIFGQAQAVEPSIKPAVQVKGERGDFESISVVIRGFWVGNRTITIRGDGSYDFELIRSPQLGNHKVNYQTNYRLRPEHLKQLEELLKETDWLAAPGTGRYATDATQYVLTLVRAGQQKTITCHSVDRSKSYNSLVKFVERINRQEWLLYNANYVPSGMRMVVHELGSELRALQREPNSVYVPVLDYQRLVPTFKRTLSDPTDRPADEVVIAIRLFSYLGDKSQRNHIVALANDRDSSVRNAVANALYQLGGVESVAVLRQMMRTTPDATAWGLIRLGEIAVPTIIEIFEEPPSAYDIRQMKIVRAYIDNWEKVPKPVDEKVINAVREDLSYRLEHEGEWTGYYKEFLKLAGATEAIQEVKQGALEGTITASNGNVAADYEIRLLGTKDSKFSELSNKEGNYRFSKVPAGLYRLVCSPKTKNHPRLVIEKVRIKENETVVENMSFESRYTFSGRVSYENGQPAVGIDVRGIWRWMDSKMKFGVFVKTDERGRYTLGTPLKIAAWEVNIGGFGTGFVGPRQPHRNVEPGRTDVDFVLKKKVEAEEQSGLDRANNVLLKAGLGTLGPLDNLSAEDRNKLHDRIRKADSREKQLLLKAMVIQLQSEQDPKKKHKIMISLVIFGRNRVVAGTLKGMLRSERDRGVRKFAAHILGRVGSEEDIDDLLDAIKKDKGAFPHGRDLANTAYFSIAEIGGDKAAIILLKLWDDKELVPDFSLFSMGFTGSPLVLDLLQEVLERKEDRFRPNAAGGLSALAIRNKDNKEMAEQILKLLRKYVMDDDPKVRENTLDGFYSMGQAEDLSLINSLLDDPYSNVVNFTENGEVKEKTVYPIREKAQRAITKINGRIAKTTKNLFQPVEKLDVPPVAVIFVGPFKWPETLVHVLQGRLRVNFFPEIHPETCRLGRRQNQAGLGQIPRIDVYPA